MSLLQIHDLHAAINGKEILKGVNLEIGEGEVHEFEVKTLYMLIISF